MAKPPLGIVIVSLIGGTALARSLRSLVAIGADLVVVGVSRWRS